MTTGGSSTSVGETVMPAECKLVFTAEFGHRGSQHLYLLDVTLPHEVIFPLFPGFVLELLRVLFLVDSSNLDVLLSYKVVMKLTIFQRLLLVFLSFAHRCGL